MEESLNAHTLQTELQQLADRAGPERSVLIQNYVAASRTQSLAVRFVKAHEADGAVRYHGLFGGAPWLPQNFDWPKDRAGAPMLFIAQFDLGRLPAIDVNWPKQGLLSIFRSEQILTMPVKDRRSFHISYLPDAKLDYELLPTQRPPVLSSPFASPFASSVASPFIGPSLSTDTGAGSAAGPSPQAELQAWAVLTTPSWTVSEQLDDLASQCNLPSTTIDELKDWAQKFNLVSCGNNRFFPADLTGLAEQREVCAFASGGISHSPVRARDSHYSHLLDDAPNWLLLAQFDQTGLFNDSGKVKDQNVAQIRLLIRREDLELGLFERGWMICCKQESN